MNRENCETIGVIVICIARAKDDMANILQRGCLGSFLESAAGKR